jgi:hypothetical protein
MPNQLTTWYPGTVSAIAGRSGNEGERFGPVTASPRSLPSFTCGESGTALEMVSLTWPASMSVTIGPTPLYGICTRSSPAMLLNSSMARWK